MKKRLIALFFAFCMIFNLSFSAFAADETVIKILVEERIETNDTNSYVTNTNPDTSEKDKIIPFNNKDYYVFQINVPETGLYTVNMRCGVHNTYPLKTQISVFNGTEYEVLLDTQLKGTGGYTRVANQDIGVVSLTEGTHKIKFLNTWSDAYLAYITFTLIPSLNVSEIKVNSEEISDGDIIPRGADNFEITLNQDFDANTVSNDTVYLFDGVKKVDSVLSVSENTISLKLKETLDFEKDYTLFVDGIASENSTLEESFTFKTSSDSSDDGKASLSQPDFSIVAGVISASGVMYGSEGLTIAGREVELYVTDPDGNGGDSVLDTAVTNENGEYSLEYELSSDAISGVYAITVGGEYIADDERKSGTALFISPQTEKEFLEEIESSLDGEDIKICIETYADELGIDLDADLSGLSATDLIFDNLANNSYSSAGEFTKAYHAEILTAKINEATTEEDIDELFTIDKNVEILGVDTLKFAALGAVYNDYIGFVLDLENMQDSSEMKDALSKLLDSALALEFGLTSADLIVNDFELFAGETLVIPLDLAEAKDNIKAYTLEISSNIITEKNITLDSENDATLTVDGNIATISFESETPISALESLGNIKIANVAEGTHDFIISGELKQSSNGFDIAVEFNVVEFCAVSYPKKPGFVYDSALSTVTELGLANRTNQSFKDSIQTLNGIDYVGFHASSHDWVEFPISIDEAGDYRVIVYAGIGTESYSPKVAVSLAADGSSVYDDIAIGALTYTGGWTKFKDHYIATKTFEAGNYKLKISASYADVYLAGIKLVSATNIGVRDIKVGADSLLKSDNAKRGSDVIEVLFSSDLYDGTITTDTLKISDGVKFLDAEVSQDGDKAFLILNETLNYDSTYSVIINDVSDIYNASIISNTQFNFATYGDDIDDGQAEVVELKGNMIYEDVEITGSLLGSAGQKMAGREVQLYLKKANGSITDVLATVVTDSNGEFEIEYSLPKDNEAGAYTFLIGSDYIEAAERSECVLTYITRELGDVFLNELEETANISDVKTLLEDNETMLMIDVSEDLADLDDTDEFYSYFIGISLEDMSSFFDLYKKAILAEKINQADDSVTIESILSNDDSLELLEIKKSRLDLLIKNKDAFITSVYNLDVISDVDALFAQVAKLFEANLAEEYKKEDSELTSKNTSIYTGYSATVELGFTEPIVNAKVIEVLIEASEDFLLEDIKFNDVAQGTLDTEYIAENKLKITFKPSRPNRELKEIATLILAPSEDDGEYSLNIYGNISYSIPTSNELVLTNIINKTVDINVNKKQGGGGTSGGGTTREPSGVTRLPDNDVPNIDVPVTPPDVPVVSEPFNDLGNVEWAKASILKLHELGIISDSENKKFNPDNKVKKEELVKMIVLALNLELTGESNLNDVDKNAWYYQFVASAQHHGLVLGNDEGKFGIGTNLSRQDLCVIIARAISNGDLSTNDSVKFTDDNSIAEYAKESVYWLKVNGMIDGVGDNTFAPNEPVTRAMAAKLIDSVLSFANKEVK